MPSNTRARKRKNAAMTETETDKLGQISNASIQAVTDLTNTLRDLGLNKDLDVPSTVVVGDTSAGKSSVMSRLTGRPFASGAGIKTIFVTEVIMKPASEERVTIEVLSNEGSLHACHEITIDSFAETFEEAARKLRKVAKPSQQTLFDGVLRIEMRGPQCPPLTVIDLPGLMHSTKRKVSQEDIKLSATLINRYLSKSRTLILAVVSATNELLNQAILEMAALVDPKGERTMGVLTKLDTIHDTEDELIRTLRNKEVPLKLGWHGLVNIVQREDNASKEKVNKAEEDFFAQPRFRKVDKECIGINAFRLRITEVIGRKLMEAIPAVEAEAQYILEAAQSALLDLGQPRHEVNQHREFLLQVSQRFEQLLKADLDSGENGRSGDHRSRHAANASNTGLRAELRDLQHYFGHAMRCYGASFGINDNSAVRIDKYLPPMYKAWASACPSKTLANARDWIVQRQQTLSQAGIPGVVSDRVTAELVLELSSRWRSLAIKHIQHVQETCEAALTRALHVATGNTKDAVIRIEQRWITSHLTALAQEGIIKVQEIWSDKTESLTSNDPALAKSATAKYNAAMKSYYVVNSNSSLEQMAAMCALAGVRAYYEMDLEHWVKNVGSQVVQSFQRSLKEAVTHDRAQAATEEEVASLVSEPKEILEKRNGLELKIDRLEKALEQINEHKDKTSLE